MVKRLITFKFKIPKIEPSLSNKAKLALELGSLSERLANEERYYLVNHLSGRAENVAEHSHMLNKIAPIMAMMYYPKLNAGLVSLYSAIHDDVEAYVGDTPTHELNSKLIKNKNKQEKSGLNQLIKEYKHLPAYTKLITEYEDQIIPEARFVRLLDKIMPAMMHFNNKGYGLKNVWKKDEIKYHSRDKTKHYIKEYPEFKELLELREEILNYLIKKYY